MKTCIQALSLLGVSFFTLQLSAREPEKEPIKQFHQSSNLAFISNAGQITDQHYQPRHDVDFKLNAKGLDIFIGDREVHYQFLNRDLGGIKRLPG